MSVNPKQSQMKLHPVAELFPPMPEEEFQVLKADIEKNDLDEPVLAWKGMIVDGRHRARAIYELGKSLRQRTCRISAKRKCCPASFARTRSVAI